MHFFTFSHDLEQNEIFLFYLQMLPKCFCTIISSQAQLIGLNSIVFNEELPETKKSTILQKTEDKQVKLLVICKNAALGFELMGSKANCQCSGQAN